MPGGAGSESFVCLLTECLVVVAPSPSPPRPPPGPDHPQTKSPDPLSLSAHRSAGRQTATAPPRHRRPAACTAPVDPSQQLPVPKRALARFSVLSDRPMKRPIGRKASVCTVSQAGRRSHGQTTLDRALRLAAWVVGPVVFGGRGVVSSSQGRAGSSAEGPGAIAGRQGHACARRPGTIPESKVPRIT